MGVLILILLSVISSIVVIFVTGSPTEDKALFVRLIQITFGMVLGSSCVFFGVIVSWLGITASYALTSQSDVSSAKGQLNFQNVSPGIILILSGSLLIGASLYKVIEYSHSTIVQEEGVSVQRKPEVPAKNLP